MFHALCELKKRSFNGRGALAEYPEAVLKRILFRTNIRRNSSAEYSAETDISKFEKYLF